MTEDVEFASPTRDRWLEAAKKELASFERQEREFRKREQRERATELPMPGIKHELLRN
jgi:hypothetical protein